jgi:NADH-quinone oxidoreductase subunit E
MSVRRLAEEKVQPKDFAFNRANGAVAKGWIKKYPKDRAASAVIPLLMIAQEQEGWVTKASIEHVAVMLDMPYIRVLEVATFYTQFMLQPVGTKAHIQVCGTTPCMLRGSEALMEVCKSKIHHDQFHINDEGTLSWEEVECQGACVNAPMVMIFKDTYEDLTPERLAEIIDEFEAGRGERVTAGPQVDRIYSGPEGGLTTLKSEILVKAGGSKKSSTSKKASTKDTPMVPPAEAARPKTEAPETNPSLKAPTKKVDTGNTKTKSKGPLRLKKAEGKADDLKLISGVGPKLEKTLNGLGFWHFSQIANWTKTDVAIVDNELKFKGRIERDDWIKQAKVLAKGAK